MGIETALPLIIQGVGAGMQASSAYDASKANKAAYTAQAQVAKNNEQIAQWQADDAIRRGDVAASDAGIKANQFKGTQRARMAANGVDLGFGSAAEILTDTDYFGAIDRARITDAAAREAWGYRSQATDFASNASLLASRADAESPFMAGATSLLGSAGRVASVWYQPGGVTRASSGDGLSQGDRRKIGVY